MDGLFGFILAEFALLASPGPATLSLAGSGAGSNLLSGHLYNFSRLSYRHRAAIDGFQ